MKLEDQVCTLEQAKKLKELGINHALFYYREYKSSKPEYSGWKILPKALHDVEWEYGLSVKGRIEPHIETVRNTYACGEFPYGSAGELFPAYTVAELGEMLPHEYLRSDIDKDFEMQHGRGVWPTGSGWGARVERASGGTKFFPNEAEARAFLLISLIESKLIAVEEINKRLQQ